MKIAYFDAPSGIAGDMTVAALLDAGGFSVDRLAAALQVLPVAGYHLAARSVSVAGLAALHFEVLIDEVPKFHRNWANIRSMIETAADRGLSTGTVERALAVFTVLAEAEAEVHGVEVERVHFHEVGAVDSIVDIVGAAWCLDQLDIDACFCGPLPSGSGYVDTEHGRLPVPAPATIELLRGFEIVAGDGEGELITPTGAAILAAMAKPLRPGFALERIGCGAGTRSLEDRPNVLRVLIGEADAVDDSEIVSVEADIDAMTPETLALAAENLRAAGARDVTVAPIAMKKGRLGMRLQVLCDLGRLDSLAACMLNETSTIGLRYRRMGRVVLPRRLQPVATEFGSISVKIVVRPDGSESAEPEFDDVAAACRRSGASFEEVRAATLAALDGPATGEGRKPHERPAAADREKRG